MPLKHVVWKRPFGNALQTSCDKIWKGISFHWQYVVYFNSFHDKVALYMFERFERSAHPLWSVVNTNVNRLNTIHPLCSYLAIYCQGDKATRQQHCQWYEPPFWLLWQQKWLHLHLHLARGFSSMLGYNSKYISWWCLPKQQIQNNVTAMHQCVCESPAYLEDFDTADIWLSRVNILQTYSKSLPNPQSKGHISAIYMSELCQKMCHAKLLSPDCSLRILSKSCGLLLGMWIDSDGYITEPATSPAWHFEMGLVKVVPHGQAHSGICWDKWPFRAISWFLTSSVALVKSGTKWHCLHLWWQLRQDTSL